MVRPSGTSSVIPLINKPPVQAEHKGEGFEGASGDDFLSREKALLGDDADQFATGNDSAAFADDDNDLLGGGNDEEVVEFESSFPAIDTRNEVGTFFPSTAQSHPFAFPILHIPVHHINSPPTHCLLYTYNTPL